MNFLVLFETQEERLLFASARIDEVQYSVLMGSFEQAPVG